jgi:DNA-binding beta-propeller fold protein YncE
MRSGILLYVSVSIFLLVTPSHSIGKTYAYFIGPQGKIAKLDTDTNSFAQMSLKTPPNATLDKILGADTVNNHIFVTHCVRLGSCKIGVYGLKTLDFIKELPLEADEPDVQVLIYPDGTKLVIQFLSLNGAGGGGGYTTDVFDAKTLNFVKNLQTIFGMEEVMFSADSKKIYSVIDGADAHVDTIDSSTFQVLTSKDLIQIWRKEPEVFSSGVESFGAGKILIFENLQAAKRMASKLDLYSYQIDNMTISPRISTGLQGDAVFNLGGSKIIFDETQDVRDKDGDLRGYKSLGRMHIYDVATGKELKMISFKAQGQGKIRGIRPAGDRLYYQSDGLTKNTSNITVIDIKNYQVVTTISLPFKPLSLIFFEQ